MKKQQNEQNNVNSRCKNSKALFFVGEWARDTQFVIVGKVIDFIDVVSRERERERDNEASYKPTMHFLPNRFTKNKFKKKNVKNFLKNFSY